MLQNFCHLLSAHTAAAALKHSGFTKVLLLIQTASVPEKPPKMQLLAVGSQWRIYWFTVENMPVMVSWGATAVTKFLSTNTYTHTQIYMCAWHRHTYTQPQTHTSARPPQNI